MTDQPSPNPKMQIPIHSASLFRLKAAPQTEIFWLIHTPLIFGNALVALLNAYY